MGGLGDHHHHPPACARGALSSLCAEGPGAAAHAAERGALTAVARLNAWWLVTPRQQGESAMKGVAQAFALVGAATLTIAVASCQKYSSGGGAASPDSIKETIKA